jgi:hypothetical protein
MKRTLDELEAIVRARVCGVCSDRTVDGECGRDEPATCGLFRLFPHVANAIEATHSDDIRDYIESIRKRVCTICEAEMSDGSCQERAEVRCALDAYLMLVVDAIEEATGKEFDRGFLAQAPPVTVRLVADGNAG